MSTLQTLISIVLLIFVLSVIVQAVQELVKSALNTKASVMSNTMTRFMGEHLHLAQLTGALRVRGLGIHALETFDMKAFRELLNGIPFDSSQLRGIVASADSSEERVKDNIAAAFDGALAAFQAAYTRRNKLFAVIISFVLVLLLNANIINLYQQVSVDAVVQQTLVGQAGGLGTSGQAQTGQLDLHQAYSQAQKQIGQSLQDYPILVRTKKYREDFQHPFGAIAGLAVMGMLVSLGAPFWNDVLKSLMGVNNALNTKPKHTP